MRITTLNQLKEYTTYTYYKLNKPEYTKKKKQKMGIRQCKSREKIKKK
mgnify:CR=1 FL=1